MRTKYMFSFLITIAVGLLMACTPTPEPKERSTIGSGSEALPAVPAIQPVMTDSMVPATVQSPDVTTMLNPPHGQPYHRCDIAVGAPLNTPVGIKPSTPAKPQAQPQMQLKPQPQSQPVNTAPQTSPIQTTAGLNPPHGQPNHRCDIAVGAPLNSPPAKKP